MTSKADGILGLAYESIASSNATPFFDVAYQQGAIATDVFSFFLSEKQNGNDSQLILGGVDPSLFIGEIKYYPITLDAWYVVAA